MPSRGRSSSSPRFEPGAARSSALPQESITSTKAKHLVAASQHYLERHSLMDMDWRIDLVSINWPRGSAAPGIEHLEYAVEGGQA